jgi:hypothetical protein
MTFDSDAGARGAFARERCLPSGRLAAAAFLPLTLALAGDAPGAPIRTVEWVSQGRSSALPRRVLDVLEAPDEVTLLELIPESAARTEEGGFHDRSVAARGPLVDTMARNALSIALTDAFRRLQPDRFCFLPRHGLRLRRGTDVVDLVASFECERAEIHTSWGEEGALGVDEAAQTQFDALFDRAGARRARRPPPPSFAPEPED